MKKHLYMAEAERMYVTDQMTIAEISERLKLAEKTVRNWKTEGGWDDKRIKHLQERSTAHEELYKLSRLLMRSISDDLENGREISQSRMYAFVRMLPQLIKVKQYEDVIMGEKIKDGQDEGKGFTPEIINKLDELLFGMG